MSAGNADSSAVERFLLAIQDSKDQQDALTKIEDAASMADYDNVITADMMLDGFSIDQPATWTCQNIFVVFHLLYHERIVMLYHRKSETAINELRRSHTRSDISDDVDPTSTIMQLRAKQQTARAAIFAAAHRIANMINTVIECELLRYAPSFV